MRAITLIESPLVRLLLPPVVVTCSPLVKEVICLHEIIRVVLSLLLDVPKRPVRELNPVVTPWVVVVFKLITAPKVTHVRCLATHYSKTQIDGKFLVIPGLQQMWSVLTKEKLLLPYLVTRI